MTVGIIAAKAGWVHSVKGLTNIVLYAATPCVIVNSFITSEITGDTLAGMGKTAIFAIIMHLTGIIISRPLFRKSPEKRKSVYMMAAVFANCGYMGIPLAEGLFGRAAVVYISVFVAVFQLFAWTYGLRLFQPGGKLPVKRLIINPGVLSLITGLLLLASGLQLPRIITEPIRLIGGLNSPLAMIVMGFYLASASLFPRKTDGKLWLAIGLRLIVVPAIMLALTLPMGFSGLWLAACLCIAGAPSATNVLMFSAKHGGDSEEAARLVSFANLVSMITIPVILGIMMNYIKI